MIPHKGSKKINSLDEFLGLFKRTEIQDISSPLCYDIINRHVDGLIAAFLQDHGRHDLAEKVCIINSDYNDDEIMKQLYSVFTDKGDVSFNINSCYQVLESSVEDDKAIVKIKILKKITAEVEIGVRQNDKIKKELLKLGEYKINEEKQFVFSIDKKQQVVIIINNEIYKIIKPNTIFAFSVSPTKKVYFSKGNLQYQASTRSWRFAEHQWDVIGGGNVCISPVSLGWIDLFGWGTGDNPTQSSTDGYDYSHFAEWGKNNISKGCGKKWFTLTKDEWWYVLFWRHTKSGILCAKATVNGVNGVILFPDNWNSSNYNLKNINKSAVSFNSNLISESVWNTKFEANGAVFLPAAGYRTRTYVYDVGSYGFYWTATDGHSIGAYAVFFGDSDLESNLWNGRDYGRSVRLVCSAE